MTRRLLLALLALETLPAQDMSTDSLGEIRPLAVMVDADSQAGAGVIFAIRNDRIYIVTANHVVRPNNVEARSVQVFFRWLPGEPFKATILNPHDANALDLAVIAVPNVKATGADKQSLFFEQIGQPGTLADGVRLRAIGHPAGAAWEISDAVRARKADGIRISLRDSDLPNGYSGGPVLDDNGLIVGIGREAQEITRIDRAIEQLKSTQWNFEVDLREPFWGVHFRETLLRYVDAAQAGFLSIGEKVADPALDATNAAAFVPTVKFADEDHCLGGIMREHRLGVSCFFGFGLDRPKADQLNKALVRIIQLALPNWRRTASTDAESFLNPMSTVSVEVHVNQFGKNGASPTYTLILVVNSLKEIKAGG